MARGGLQNYAFQTVWSDPGNHAARYAELPPDPAAIPDSLGNFVIHHAVARSLGFGVPTAAEGDRRLRTVGKLLDVAVERDRRHFSMHRELADFLYGSCHEFALLAASVLRANGVPARLRVGFVDYFRADRWEDHWLCEYWSNDRWLLLDAQLGYRARDALKLRFPAHEVDRSRFRSAPEIWALIRSGDVDPAVCGVSFAGISGAWFVATGVLRDLAALAAIEALPWDYWGPARDFALTESVSQSWDPQIDALAAALVPAPDTKVEALELFEAYQWAHPTESVLSNKGGRFEEDPLGFHPDTFGM